MGKKKRTSQEIIELLGVVLKEYTFDKTWGHKKSVEYYRSRVGLRATNDIYEDFLEKKIDANEFMHRVNMQKDPKRAKLIHDVDEINKHILAIQEIAKGNDYIFFRMTSAEVNHDHCDRTYIFRVFQ